MGDKVNDCAAMNTMLEKQAVDAEHQVQKKPYEEPSVVFVPEDVLRDALKEIASCPYFDI